MQRTGRTAARSPATRAAISSAITLSPVELGSVDFTQLELLAPSDGDLWFQLVTAYDGWLTAQAVDEWTVEELTVQLFDPENLAVPAATSTRQEGRPRLDHEVQQGQTYLLQVTGTTNDASLPLRRRRRLSG